MCSIRIVSGQVTIKWPSRQWLKPVSYTHLLALIAALVSVAFKEALYRYTVFKGKRLNSQAVVANAWPVSYTHLDVYKRQHLWYFE